MFIHGLIWQFMFSEITTIPGAKSTVICPKCCMVSFFQNRIAKSPMDGTSYVYLPGGN